MHFLGSELISWQTMVYCFSFCTLMATFVMGAFSPFCRKRQVPFSLGVASLPPTVATQQAIEATPRVEKERVAEKDRIANAIRQWTNERADSDLAFVAPLPPPPAAMEPEQETDVQPEPKPRLDVPERRAIELPPPAPVTAHQAPVQEEPQAVAETNPFLMSDFHGAPNFYEILQISPRADLETIHRVYRIMAARFHPDNPVSGDHEIFLQLCQAYEVLSRPERRDLYDRALRLRETEPIPIFGARIFVDGLDGELNRRFGLLALLYQRRRTNQGNLGISTLELETRMALPREHLEFTLWYLRSKGFVQILEENSDYAVTASGVDYVESNSSKNPILRELLTAGSFASRPATPAPEPCTKRHARSKSEARRARREGVVIR